MFDLKNAYARMMMKLPMRYCNSGDTANVAANILINEEWRSVELQHSYIIVTLKNGTEIIFWNKSKFYAWMSRGIVQNTDHRITWEKEMPDSYLMLLVDEKLKRWTKQKTINYLKNFIICEEAEA